MADLSVNPALVAWLFLGQSYKCLINDTNGGMRTGGHGLDTVWTWFHECADMVWAWFQDAWQWEWDDVGGQNSHYINLTYR